MTTTPRHAIDWFEISCLDLDRAQALYEHALGVALTRENYAGPDMRTPLHRCAAQSACSRSSNSSTADA